MKLTATIVSSDVILTRVLTALCEKIPFLQLNPIPKNNPDILGIIQQEELDLVIIDADTIQLPDESVLQKRLYLPQLIAITSQTEPLSIKYMTILPKPIIAHHFRKVIDSAYMNHYPHFSNTDTLIAQQTPKVIFIRNKGCFIRIDVDDILYFENTGEYVSIKTKKGSHLIHSTMKDLDLKLGNTCFVKIHRSYIINLDYVQRIADTSVLVDNKSIPMSRSHRSTLLNLLNIL